MSSSLHCPCFSCSLLKAGTLFQAQDRSINTSQYHFFTLDRYANTGAGSVQHKMPTRWQDRGLHGDTRIRDVEYTEMRC